jgi:sulfoxide reductase heme-binding subunit YedZ
MNSFLSNKWLKVAVFLVCLFPAAIIVWDYLHLAGILVWGALQDGLTSNANPVEYITHNTGDWTIRFLIITLAITPARRLLKLPAFIRYRRMLGLFAFFYGCLHFTTYIWLVNSFDIREMLTDVSKRKFITVGFAGFLMMAPLAITSTAGWIRRMGGKNWIMLHRLIYFSAIAGVIHYAWLVKSDERKPIQYGVLVGLLLLYRLVVWITGKKQKTGGRVAAAVARPMETSESA